MVEEPNGKLGSISTGARVGIPTEEESERPLPIDGVHKGWTRLDVVGPRITSLLHGLYLFVADDGELGNLGGLVPPGLGQRGSGHPLAKELGDQRVPQTLGPTQTRERHTKLEKGVPRERHNKSYTREKAGWE